MANSQTIVSHPFTDTFIRIKARQLCRRTDYSRSDFDDLQQGMRLYLLEKAHLYDPSRGTIEAFVTNAVNTWVGMDLRRRGRLKRSNGSPTISLEGTMVECEGDTVELGSVLGEDDLLRRTGGGGISEIDKIDMRDAVAHAMTTLTDDERDLLRHVVDHGVASAARQRGVSRRQIENALARMRGRFEDAGFGEG